MEQYKYQIFKIKGQKFIVKLDLNPLTLVTPQQAIAAYFTKTTEIYNSQFDRYELYSES